MYGRPVLCRVASTPYPHLGYVIVGRRSPATPSFSSLPKCGYDALTPRTEQVSRAKNS